MPDESLIQAEWEKHGKRTWDAICPIIRIVLFRNLCLWNQWWILRYDRQIDLQFGNTGSEENSSSWIRQSTECKKGISSSQSTSSFQSDNCTNESPWSQRNCHLLWPQISFHFLLIVISHVINVLQTALSISTRGQTWFVDSWGSERSDKRNPTLFDLGKKPTKLAVVRSALL